MLKCAMVGTTLVRVNALMRVCGMEILVCSRSGARDPKSGVVDQGRREMSHCSTWRRRRGEFDVRPGEPRWAQHWCESILKCACVEWAFWCALGQVPGSLKVGWSTRVVGR